VIDFYNKGGAVGMGLKLDNQTLSSDRLNLNTEEKKALIAFLKTLTDNQTN
jgi:cytochrome c peroxidase